MPQSNIPASRVVKPCSARAPASRARFYARVYAQLLRLLAQMALR